MNPFLAKLSSMEEIGYPRAPSKPSKLGFEGFEGNPSRCFSEKTQPTDGLHSRLARTLGVLESRCPDLIPIDRWHQGIEDSRRFLAKWGEQAGALGWTVRDLFGLASIPDKPHPSYWRLSRYDETGLIWLLRGRPVLALTEGKAAIESPTGSVTIYRRHDKPALGPLGDSLDDFR